MPRAPVTAAYFSAVHHGDSSSAELLNLLPQRHVWDDRLHRKLHVRHWRRIVILQPPLNGLTFVGVTIKTHHRVPEDPAGDGGRDAMDSPLPAGHDRVPGDSALLMQPQPAMLVMVMVEYPLCQIPHLEGE